MPAAKRKAVAKPTAAMENADADTGFNDMGPQDRPAKRNCRLPSEPFHMMTRRSASAAASAKNSAPSSAIQSEAEGSRRNSIQHEPPTINNVNSDDIFPSTNTETTHPSSEAPKPTLRSRSKIALKKIRDHVKAAGKRKRENELDEELQEDEHAAGGTGVKIEGNEEPTHSVNEEQPLKRRRGRAPKQKKKEQANTSAEPTPGPQGLMGKLNIPTATVKRPPGRPRKAKPVSNQEGAEAAIKRPPGRRAAAGANSRVEAIRIRQAQLKRQFNGVARATKSALGELANRTIAGLKADPKAHEKSQYFDEVQGELDARLADKLAELEKDYQRVKAYQEHMKDAEGEVLIRGYETKFQDIKDAYINRIKYEFCRESLRGDKKSEGDQTDDEGVPSGVFVGPTAPTYDPHSTRFDREVDRIWSNRGRCQIVRETLLAINMFNPAILPRAFTATAASRHEQAVAATNLDILALAAKAKGAAEENMPPQRPQTTGVEGTHRLKWLAWWAVEAQEREREVSLQTAAEAPRKRKRPAGPPAQRPEPQALFRPREIRPAPPAAIQALDPGYGMVPPALAFQAQAVPLYPAPAGPRPAYYHPGPPPQYPIPPPPYFVRPLQGSMGPPPLPPHHFRQAGPLPRPPQ